MDYVKPIPRLRATSIAALMALALSSNTTLAAELPSTISLSLKTVSRIAPQISDQVVSAALRALSCATSRSDLRPSTLAIIDYSLPSTKPRFWLLDLEQQKLLLQELVAHGKGSGENFANRFSNEPGSLSSSLGLYQAGERYVGTHGPSLRLIGLERGYNDRAFERAIVLHGATYVSPEFIAEHQRLGRSWGCPALSPAAAKRAISFLSDTNGFLFVYYPDSKWLKSSPLLKSCSS